MLPRELKEEAEERYKVLKKIAGESIDKEKLKKIILLSDFVFNTILNYPSSLEVIDEKIKKRFGKEDYIRRIGDCIEEEIGEFKKRLRRQRNKELLRIAWKDIVEGCDVFEVMKELSAFADACILRTMEYTYRMYSHRFGSPAEKAQTLTVIALGKLGGEELNFSSDIDIMFAYPEEGVTYSKITNSEFFSYMAQSIINILSEHTEDGFVFRVDTRLRPFGESGPIVMNFDEMEDYYYTYGREWERYALIKARVIGGNEEIIHRIRKFVYRKYLDYGVFEALREMKEKIESETKDMSIDEDIKLGPGGIREIEFFVQVFQLLRGGIDPELQTPSLLKAISVLGEKGYLDKKICSGLISAYRFFRRLENRIQQYKDLQTHRLPKERKERIKLAFSMGFEDWDSFFKTLLYWSSFVRKNFSQLLGKKEKTEDIFVSIWNTDEREKRKRLLSSIGASKKVETIIDELKQTRYLGQNAKRILDKLMPVVLKKIFKEEENVSLAISRIIKSIQTRTNYLSLLLENPSVIDHLIRLAKESSWIISFVSKNPALLDELIDPRTLYNPPRREELKRDINNRLKMISDLEDQIIQLCLFRQTNTLRVAAADIEGAISTVEVSSLLTQIAEVVLEKALEISMNKFGKKDGFCIIGYGKLGGRELGYNSDLDIVFIHTEDPSSYIKVSQHILKLLTTYTVMGKVYEIDTRLRPDGSSGVLSVNISSFEKYQLERAWTWEHQALLRARGICGDKKVMKAFEDIRYKVLSKKREKGKLFEEVWDMKERIRKNLLKPVKGLFHIKYERGGIIDIEFLIQYLVLLNAHLFPEILKRRSHIHFIEELVRVSVMDKEDGIFLKNAYIELRSMLNRLSLQEKPFRVERERVCEIAEKVERLWEKYS